MRETAASRGRSLASPPRLRADAMPIVRVRPAAAPRPASVAANAGPRQSRRSPGASLPREQARGRVAGEPPAFPRARRGPPPQADPDAPTARRGRSPTGSASRSDATPCSRTTRRTCRTGGSADSSSRPRRARCSAAISSPNSARTSGDHRRRHPRPSAAARIGIDYWPTRRTPAVAQTPRRNLACDARVHARVGMARRRRGVAARPGLAAPPLSHYNGLARAGCPAAESTWADAFVDPGSSGRVCRMATPTRGASPRAETNTRGAGASVGAREPPAPAGGPMSAELVLRRPDDRVYAPPPLRVPASRAVAIPQHNHRRLRLRPPDIWSHA